MKSPFGSWGVGGGSPVEDEGRRPILAEGWHAKRLHIIR